MEQKGKGTELSHLFCVFGKCKGTGVSVMWTRFSFLCLSCPSTKDTIHQPQSWKQGEHRVEVGKGQDLD